MKHEGRRRYKTRCLRAKRLGREHEKSAVMKKPVSHLVLLGLCLLLASCRLLPVKTTFRIGVPNRPEAMAPLEYNRFLPKQYRADVMKLNAADELKIALLVEAVDLAVLPVKEVLEENVQTHHFVILAGIARSTAADHRENSFLVLVCKKNLLKKYPLPIKDLLQAHQQASQYLNDHHAAWQQQAVDQGLDSNSSQLIIGKTVLTWAVDDAFKSAVKEKGQALVAAHALPAEPDYATLWP